MAHYTTSIGRCREQFSPCTLQELCIQVCVTNAESIFFEQVTVEKWNLKNWTAPLFVEEVWKRYDHSAPEYLPMMLEIGRCVESNQIALKRVDMSNCKILNDEHLENLMRILPVSLALNNCPLLTNEAFNIINRYGQNLVHLHLGTSAAHVIPSDVQDWIECTGSGVDDGLLKTPNLVKLTMWGLKVNQYQHINQKGQGKEEEWVLIDYWDCFTRAFAPNLVHMDISDCGVVENLSFLIRSKDTLQSLHLSNVLNFDFDRGTWSILPNLNEIRSLDITRYDSSEWGPRPMDIPQITLRTLVSSLPKLEMLDKAGLRVVEGPNEVAFKLFPLCESVGNDSIQPLLEDISHYSQRRNGAYIPVIFLALLRRIKFGVPWMPLYSIAGVVMETLKNIENPCMHVAGLRILLEATKSEAVLGPSLRQSLFRLVCHSMNKCVLHVGVAETGILLCSALSLGTTGWDPSFAKVMVSTLLRAAKNAALTLTIDPFGSKRSILNRIPVVIFDNVDPLTASQITSISLENDMFTLHCTLCRMDNMKVVAGRYGQLYLRFNPDGRANLGNANDHMLVAVLRAING